MAFWQDLKRRKIVQWALGYAAFALVVLELADFLSDAFEWPTVALRVLTVFVAFGFLCVLVVAWFHGESGHQRMRPAELALLLLLVVTGGGVAWEVGTGHILAGEPAGGPGGANDTQLVLADRAELDPSEAANAIAVLPFVDIGGDGDDRAFADGITEDIIAQLGSIGSLRVISRTSVMGYRDTAKPIRQIGQELGVNVVLEGSIRVEGNRVRIVAQLIDARTDVHLWAETYDEDVSDVLKVQADVAQKIAAALQTTLTPAAEEWLADARRQERDPVALALYQEGRQLAQSGRPEDREKAKDLFHRAVARDSTLTAAWTALAELSAAAPMPAAPAVPAADAEAEEAVAIAVRADARNPRAHVLSGVHQATRRGDLEAAENSVREALRLNPNDAEARIWLGRILLQKGEEQRALREYRIAQRIDPRSAEVRNEMGELLMAMNRPEEAAEELKWAVRLDSSMVTARVNLGMAFQQLGLSDSARVQVENATRFLSEPGFVQGIVAQGLASVGRADEARDVARKLGERAERGEVPAIVVAQVWLAVGDTAAARPWIERSGDRGRTMLMMMSPRFRFEFGEVLGVPDVPAAPRPAPPDSARRRRGGD